jgi:hypothetical protein
MDQAQREGLAQQIRQAFAKTPYPKGGFISDKWTWLFPRRSWEYVSFDTLVDHWADFYEYPLNFPELRYLLAPMMIGIVLQPEEADMLCGSVIRMLSEYKNPGDRFLNNFPKLLTHEESVAISAFLNAFMDIVPSQNWPEDDADLLGAIETWDTIAQLPPEKFKGVTIKGGK